MTKPLTTFSIVARCPHTGQLGVAVSTADVGAGRMVAWAKPRVGAVAILSWPNPYIGIDGLRLMTLGMSGPDALRQLIAADPGRELRQAGIVDSQGASDAWSGSECTQWYGHVIGEGFAVQGNMLVGSATVKAMADAFTSRQDEELAERLLCAIEAGQEAGGDKRGRQCAALFVVDREEYALWDLRVDEHPQPVAELRRIYEIARLDLLPFIQGLPTRENPLGDLSDEFVEMNMRPPPERLGGGGSGPASAPAVAPEEA